MHFLSFQDEAFWAERRFMGIWFLFLTLTALQP